MAYWRRRIEFPQASALCFSKDSSDRNQGSLYKTSTSVRFNQRPLIYLTSLLLRRGLCLSLSPLYFPPFFFFFPSITRLSAQRSLSRAISHPLSVWLWLTHSILLHLCGCFWHADGVWLTAALTVTTLPASLWPGVGISGQLDERERQAVRWTAARLQPVLHLPKGRPLTTHIKLYIFWPTWDFFFCWRKMLKVLWRL